MKKLGYVALNLAVLLSLAIGVGCTKKRGTINNVDSNAYIAKSTLLGTEYNLVRKVEDADSENTANAIPGFAENFGVVKAEITDNELRFITTFDPTGREETAKVIASFPIVDHFDIKMGENDFKESTNRIVEDRKNPAQDRAYMRVDWAHPTNSFSKFSTGADVNEVNTVLTQNIKNEDGVLSFAVETGLEGNRLWKYVPPFGEDPVSAFRVKYRTYLLPVKSNDYAPNPYTLNDFEKFGYFATQLDFKNPFRSRQDSDLRIYANTFNICEAGSKKSCSTNKVTWVLTKGFPEVYLEEAKSAVETWNKTFQEALGRSDTVIELDVSEASRVEITDPRKNVIAYYEPANSFGGLLGVSQSIHNPRTGETVQSSVNVYGGGVRSQQGVVDMIIDLATSADPIAQVTGENNGAPKADRKDSSNLVHMVGAGTRGKINQKFSPYSTLNFQAAQDLAGIARKTTAAQPVFLSPSQISTSKRQKVLDDLKQIFQNKESELLNSTIANLQDEEGDSRGAERGFQVNSLMNFSQKVKAEKRKFLQQSERGIHGAEMVDTAVLNYLLRLVEGTPDLKSLAQQREAIKEKVGKLVFYTTLVHELGHSFGLRHNFRGSADKANYYPGWYGIKKRIASGDKTFSKYDLLAFSSSSVMDYGANFFSSAAGIGPYDKAAIKFGYTRSLNRNAVPKTFKFCTDHQAGEDFLCNRFDEGSTVSEITKNIIDNYNTNWALTHYRRGRVHFDRAAGSLPVDILMSTMLPVRRTMDEFMYSLITATPEGGGKGLCKYPFVRDSIKKGEIADVCDPSSAELSGVSLDDFLGTMENALKNPKTGQFFVADEADLLPKGLADLTRANYMAKRFFSSVIGSIEPGSFLALPKSQDPEDGMRLLPLAKEGTNREKLTKLARDFGIAEAEITKTVDSLLNNVIEIPLSSFARPFSSKTEEVGTFNRVSSIGSFWDKYVALIALSSRDIGVEKYSQIGMSGTTYDYPQTKMFASRIFNRMITGDMPIIQLAWKLGDGTPVKISEVPASDGNLKKFVSMLVLTDLVSDNDSSMMEKMRICVKGEAGCDAGLGQAEVEGLSAEGNKTYRAVQTIYGDSIAYGLVSKVKELSASREAAVAVLKDVDATSQKIVGSIEAAEKAQNAILESIKGMESLSNVAKMLAAPASANEQPNGIYMAKLIVGNLDSYPVTLIDADIAATANYYDPIIKELKLALNNTGRCGPRGTSCEGEKHIAEHKKLEEVVQNAELVKSNVAGALELAVKLRKAPGEVQQVSSEISGVEGTIEGIRTVMKFLGAR